MRRLPEHIVKGSASFSCSDGTKHRVPEPTDPDSTDQYFEILSWENADKYDADIILVDQRPGSPPISEFPSFSPTWSKLPAVKAGQTFEWLPYVSTSDWGTYAAQFEALTALIEGAEDVTPNN